jgi:Predicted choline kinase involved in LPS biosynthesis
MNYFDFDINNWKDWGKVFHSKEEFGKLIYHIFEIENMPKIKQISDLTPGTNAVFKVDDKVVKIFVPDAAGYDSERDFAIESYGMKFAVAQGIPVPKLVADGIVRDKYNFRYMIMDYIEGHAFTDEFDASLTYEEKYNIGEKFADIKSKLNIPCDKFCGIDIIERAVTNERWDKYPDSFNVERINYLKNYTIRNPVYVHGDINPDNIIFGDDGAMYLIDFADACIAPALYELAPLICEFFEFDSAYLDGYGNVSAEDLAESILIHDFGGDILANNCGLRKEFTSLDVLYERIKVKLCRHQ